MFNLTRQEQKAVLFLACMALVGLGVDFIAKTTPRAESFLKVSDEIIKLDINTASLEDFLHTRALSEKLARKIIEYRDIHGGFRSLEEIKEVSGIGEYRYNRMKELFFAD